MFLKCITINTDASFHLTYQAGGYAFYIVSDLFVIKKGGMFKKQPTSPVEAEIMAIGNALHALLQQKELPSIGILVINSDCIPAITSIKKSKGFLGKQVYEILCKVAAKTGCKIDFRHVRAHTGNDDKRSHVNRWCDTEAKKWMRKTVSNTKKSNRFFK